MEAVLEPTTDAKNPDRVMADVDSSASPSADQGPAKYDVIIIGGGPAGMTAAIYLARKKLKSLMLTKDIGGQAAWSSDVENYLGFSMITGTDLTKHFQDHMLKFSDEITMQLIVDGVHGITKSPTGFSVELKDGKTESARAIIIASGKIPKKLGIDGEDEFMNRGVTYCAWCDGPLFKGKSIAIIGGGNSTLDAALNVEKIVKDITIVNSTDALHGDEVMIEKVKVAQNIRILNHAQVLSISGDKLVRGVTVRDEQTGTDKELAVDGVFIEIGSVPATDYLANLVQLNEEQEIVIDKRNMSSVEGIFAAGDVTDVSEKQIIVAAGEGSKAAIQCSKWLSARP
ncbi:MAG: FAD-dependent oxidoreductase [bacterium]